MQRPYMQTPCEKQSPGQKIMLQELPPIVEFLHSQSFKGKLSIKLVLQFIRS